ncbi:MarR family winged helix-turn-helix transcriptional regulator [Lapidilactobacillus achengensis]|uniref:MarR family winged helix-turn-helix transcriptional regulator n=1 Tax=Lapidilactobacillus achengensis TaxID=2486000 RepID=A0ABW1UQB0_9LACO|nr:MarR family winged helix-turn-helix transcriptional regulator [Lapidilactobacillus achengensis]
MEALTAVLVDLAQQIRLVEQQLSEQLDLPISQMRLLLTLSEQTVSLAQLKTTLVLDNSTLSRQLAGLTSKGLVAVVTQADKRQRFYQLSPTGLQVQTKIEQQLRDLQEFLIGNWDQEEKRLLTTLLNRLLRSTAKLHLQESHKTSSTQGD